MALVQQIGIERIITMTITNEVEVTVPFVAVILMVLMVLLAAMATATVMMVMTPVGHPIGPIEVIKVIVIMVAPPKMKAVTIVRDVAGLDSGGMTTVVAKMSWRSRVRF